MRGIEAPRGVVRSSGPDASAPHNEGMRPVRNTRSRSWRARRIGRLVAIPLLLLLLLGAGALTGNARGAGDFRDDWAVAEGFTLTMHSSGYELPTAIAFVRNPGRDPKSPLYFVAELRGTVKVVTRDRTVARFANLALPPPDERYPQLGAQNGAAGICLDDEQGHVFVTYAAFDRRGVLRNGLVRFDSVPRTFGLEAQGREEIGEVFAPYPTAANHQIGGCVVEDDSLFVGVGDGTVSSRAQNLDQLAGKVVRMTAEGEPHPENPFFDAPRAAPRRYVWAYGLRNPFGIVAVGSELYATQNGISIDSFLRIERGRNYGWDGSDESIATNAEAVMIPATAPVHVAYVPEETDRFPPQYRGTFFFGSAQSAAERGAGVLGLRYDVASHRVVRAARSFVRFRRAAGGEVSAVALGPDGLYFASILPNPQAETTPVYRVAFDAAAGYPHPLELKQSGSSLFQQFGCRACHSLDNVGGTSGPPLDRPALERRVEDRLASPEYARRVEELARLDQEPFASYRDERRKVLARDGRERVLLWLEYRLLEPRFDDPDATMPKVGATPAQAAAIAEYLVSGEAEGAAPPAVAFSDRVRNTLKSKRFAAGVVAGLGFAAAAFALFGLVRRARQRPRTSH